jgi:hypothetical protein
VQPNYRKLNLLPSGAKEGEEEERKDGAELLKEFL